MTTPTVAFDARHLPVQAGIYLRRRDGSLFYTANPSRYSQQIASGDLAVASLRFIETAEVRTAEVDTATGEVKFNPVWWSTLPLKTRAFVIHHQYRQWAAHQEVRS